MIDQRPGIAEIGADHVPGPAPPGDEVAAERAGHCLQRLRQRLRVAPGAVLAPAPVPAPAAATAAAPPVRAAPAPASRVPAAPLGQHRERSLAPSCRAPR